MSLIHLREISKVKNSPRQFHLAQRLFVICEWILHQLLLSGTDLVDVVTGCVDLILYLTDISNLALKRMTELQNLNAHRFLSVATPQVRFGQFQTLNLLDLTAELEILLILLCSLSSLLRALETLPNLQSSPVFRSSL